MKFFNLKMKLIRFYPPFLGAGIRVGSFNKTKNDITTSMNLRLYNKNAVKTHFGGSLYAMCDPWYMFIIGGFLGSGYIAWDKGASISFKRPGVSKVTARFYISIDELNEIKRKVDNQETTNFEYSTNVIGSKGEIVAEVHKTIYVNTKKGHAERLAYHKSKRSKNL